MRHSVQSSLWELTSLGAVSYRYTDRIMAGQGQCRQKFCIWQLAGRCDSDPTFSLPYHFCRDMGKQHPYDAGGADGFSDFEDD